MKKYVIAVLLIVGILILIKVFWKLAVLVAFVAIVGYAGYYLMNKSKKE